MRIISRNKFWLIKLERITKSHDFPRIAKVQIVEFYSVGIVGNSSDEIILSMKPSKNSDVPGLELPHAVGDGSQRFELRPEVEWLTSAKLISESINLFEAA